MAENKAEPMTWAKIKAAALDGSHPLVNEVERQIMCPCCKQWRSEADYEVLSIPRQYFVYLAPIRRCPVCRFLFAVVN